MEPRPPAKSPQPSDLLRSLLRPSSRCAFPAAAAAPAHDTARPPVKVALIEWWLATVEGDDQKIAVAGTFALKTTLMELPPAPIVKCHSPICLETEDGTLLEINGHFDSERAHGNGYSKTVCEHFILGFPHWWQNCNLRYPKLKNSDTGCQPRSSNTSKSGVESTQFYSKKFQQDEDLDSAVASFISRHPDIFKSASHNVSMFPEPSHLSKGTPRFEEYTCDGDIATNENVVTSSEAAKGDPRTPVTCDRDIATNENVVTSSEAANGDQRTVVVASEVCGYRKETQHKSLAEKAVVDKEMRASNKKRVGRPKKLISPQEKCQSDTRSRGIRSPVSSAHWSPHTRGKAMPLSTPEDLKLKRTRSGRLIVPRLDEGCQSIVYGKDGSIAGVIGLDSPAMSKMTEPKTSRKKKRRTE